MPEEKPVTEIASAPSARLRPPLRRALLAVVVLGAGWFAWQTLRPSPAVPAPPDPARLEPQLRAYLDEMVAWTRSGARDPQRHATLGLAYAANNLWAEARLAFSNVVQLNPREPLALLYYAVAHQELGQTDEALRLLRELAERFPQFAPGQYRLGEALLRAGQMEEAERAFTRLMATAPGEWRGPAGLGEVKLRQGAAEEAARLLEHAVELDAAARPARYLLGQAYARLGRTNDAQRELALGLDAQHYPMPDDWSRQAPQHMKLVQDQTAMARELVESGQSWKAIRLLEEALKYNTNSLVILNNLGIAYNQAGQPQKARPLLERALTVDPNYVPAVVALSAAEVGLGQFEAALTNALRAVELAPRSVQPYLAQANALLALERDAEAVAALERAFEHDPQNVQILTDMGDILLRNLGKDAEALARFRQAVAVAPLSLLAHLKLADAYLVLGNGPAAAEALEAARRLAPDDPNVLALDRALKALPK
ncbi:MAG: tetratricopeptide repeat protein [Verrucomicrobia bacterium]|nr:tetratricopeptide repeat protein [Verrucomicrobiota bacterium]